MKLRQCQGHVSYISFSIYLVLKPSSENSNFGNATNEKLMCDKKINKTKY